MDVEFARAQNSQLLGTNPMMHDSIDPAAIFAIIDVLTPICLVHTILRLHKIDNPHRFISRQNTTTTQNIIL